MWMVSCCELIKSKSRLEVSKSSSGSFNRFISIKIGGLGKLFFMIVRCAPPELNDRRGFYRECNDTSVCWEW